MQIVHIKYKVLMHNHCLQRVLGKIHKRRLN